MGLFKVAQIKKMIGCVSAEQMTFSRMVELLNEDVNKEVYRVRRMRGEYKTVNRCGECLFRHNEGFVQWKCLMSENKTTSLLDIACEKFKHSYVGAPIELQEATNN